MSSFLSTIGNQVNKTGASAATGTTGTTGSGTRRRRGSLFDGEEGFYGSIGNGDNTSGFGIPRSIAAPAAPGEAPLPTGEAWRGAAAQLLDIPDKRVRARNIIMGA